MPLQRQPNLQACLSGTRLRKLRVASPMKRFLLATLLCLLARQLSAGDAIVMGYNYDGVWTAVTYYRSSTPKNGHHYWNATEACTRAERDLRTRAGKELARTKIIGQSDRTGYVTVARGSVADANKGITAIGRGQSQKEADENALKKLKAIETTANEKVVYRYFSYGMDSAVVRSKAKRGTRHLPSANHNPRGLNSKT